MVHIPVRKCWHAAKICFLLFLVVCLLSLFEQWRGGKRSAVALFSNPEEAEYERQIQEDEARIIPGLGEGGEAAHLLGEDKKRGGESEKKLAMNVYLSDRIAYNRTLKDYRNPACRRVVYDAELPSVSVIIIFHNEPYSVVLRTVWSVLNSARRSQPWFQKANFKSKDGAIMKLGYKGQPSSSPFVYLKEIILVDDNSTLPELRGKLSYYINTRLPPDMVRLLRLPEREGLTRARLAGSRLASGDVMIFLDGHCEAMEDWLRPLLQRIKEKRDTVLTPVIDMIEGKAFGYFSGGWGTPQYRRRETRRRHPFPLLLKHSYLRHEAVLHERAEKVRRGLTFARHTGAKFALGDVTVFLDSHCEPDQDWLRPLLHRVKEKRTAVLTPVIDIIKKNTLEYNARVREQVGGFIFTGHFTWIDVPEREKKRRGSDIAPTWSPTMAGGLFAINRAYYWELGAYDEQMGGWGGENLEMSFRIWQCGGTLETIPCSRVGHVFRSFHPYGLPASSDTHGINTARMAEVWMDEYAELFYIHRPDLRKNPIIGDVTHRKVLREKLQCKSFQWYLDNVYPEKFVPVRDVYAYGRFRNKGQNLCLDTLQREAAGAALGAYPCHDRLVATQYFSLSRDGRLRDEEKCAEVAHAQDDLKGHFVLMHNCRGGKHAARNQKWTYANGRLQHESSQLCLAAVRAGGDVTARECDDHAYDQQWTIDYTMDNGFQRDSEGDSASYEQLQRFKKLHGQRHAHSRISRSLLSIDDNRLDEPLTNTTHRRSHRKKHKKRTHKKKNKNKFILRIERTVPPSAGRKGNLPETATEHLEVDIRCPHNRLYPNNTFVRDLVSVLNMHDIKVINNGRVFERNRVSQLPRDKKDTLVKELQLIQPASHRGKEGQEPAEGVKPVKRPSRKRKRPAPAPHPPRAVQHNIIVDDFVEVSTDAAEPKQRYRMRKRSKHVKPQREPPAPRAPLPPDTAAAPRAPAVPHSARDALLALLGDKIEKATRQAKGSGRVRVPATARAWRSDEEAPLTLASGEHTADEWEPNPPSNSSWSPPERRDIPRSAEQAQARGLLRQYHGDDTGDHAEDRQSLRRSRKKSPVVSTDEESERRRSSDEDADGDRKRGKPVKVTMRNNFTFNIGDEFFSWRTNNEDVADILGELAIPSNSSPSSPPIEAWVRPATPPEPPSLADLTDTRYATDAHDTLRNGDNTDGTNSESGDHSKVLTGHGVMDDDESNSASKSDSYGD